MESVTSKDELMALVKDKDVMEAEIKTLLEYLQNQGVGMDAALVDQDGFPRSDIDLPAVRTARNRIICLRNDHKDIMEKIDDGLAKYHAELKQKQAASSTPMDTDTSSRSHTVAAAVDATAGFARVSQVDSGSPASEGELSVGDLVSRFGSVTMQNFNSLQQLAEIVQHSVGSSIPMEVLRRAPGGQLVITRLLIKPRKWAGKGLLGAKFDPVSAEVRR